MIVLTQEYIRPGEMNLKGGSNESSVLVKLLVQVLFNLQLSFALRAVRRVRFAVNNTRLRDEYKAGWCLCVNSDLT